MSSSWKTSDSEASSSTLAKSDEVDSDTFAAVANAAADDGNAADTQTHISSYELNPQVNANISTSSASGCNSFTDELPQSSSTSGEVVANTSEQLKVDTTLLITKAPTSVGSSNSSSGGVGGSGATSINTNSGNSDSSNKKRKYDAAAEHTTMDSKTTTSVASAASLSSSSSSSYSHNHHHASSSSGHGGTSNSSSYGKRSSSNAYGSGSNNNNNSSSSSSSGGRSHGHSSSSSGGGNGAAGETGDVYFKLLIPSSAAGGVIGRGGEKIAQIQKDAGVKMKMSKANDYYPNTYERVCLIIGALKSVLRAHDFIVERMQEKPDNGGGFKSSFSSALAATSHMSDSGEDRASQIKILIPNSTAGLLIGKAGSYIKQIKDESGAFVQISSKQTDLPERIVTIEGETEKRNKALLMVIRKIAEDPQHNSVNNLNYSSSSGGAGGLGAGGAGASLANLQGGHDMYSSGGSHLANLNGGHHGGPSSKFDFNSAANYLAGLSNLAMLIINCGGSSQMTADSLKMTLRNSGYSSSATVEIIDAITVLLSYGLIVKTPPNGNAAAVLSAPVGVIGNGSSAGSSMAAALAASTGGGGVGAGPPGSAASMSSMSMSAAGLSGSIAAGSAAAVAAAGYGAHAMSGLASQQHHSHQQQQQQAHQQQQQYQHGVNSSGNSHHHGQSSANIAQQQQQHHAAVAYHHSQYAAQQQQHHQQQQQQQQHHHQMNGGGSGVTANSQQQLGNMLHLLSSSMGGKLFA